MRISNALVFIAFFLTSSLFGQLKSPEDFLPTDYGKHFTPHHLLVDYFEHVAENSSQIILKEYGRTNEKRPLIWAVISSPENLKNLETIRTDNLKRAGLIEGTPSDYKPVAIVWLSYGVHGNEAGGSESSLATVYELTKSNNKKVQDLLETRSSLWIHLSTQMGILDIHIGIGMLPIYNLLLIQNQENIMNLGQEEELTTIILT